MRNAGNFVPPHKLIAGGEEATIEFAIVGLGIKDIIVCGHSHCGAVSALLDSDGARDAMPALCSWLKYAASARRIVQVRYQIWEKNKCLT
jgi:carbonic anhydrase